MNLGILNEKNTSPKTFKKSPNLVTLMKNKLPLQKGWETRVDNTTGPNYKMRVKS